jgi:hypothetical protein
VELHDARRTIQPQAKTAVDGDPEYDQTSRQSSESCEVSHHPSNHESGSQSNCNQNEGEGITMSNKIVDQAVKDANWLKAEGISLAARIKATTTRYCYYALAVGVILPWTVGVVQIVRWIF